MGNGTNAHADVLSYLSPIDIKLLRKWRARYIHNVSQQGNSLVQVEVGLRLMKLTNPFPFAIAPIATKIGERQIASDPDEEGMGSYHLFPCMVSESSRPKAG
jgi:hypothetical protein